MTINHNENPISLQKLLQVIALEGSLELGPSEADIYGTSCLDELPESTGGEDG